MDFGVWLTNLGRDDAEEMMRERNKTRPLNAVLIISEPKATAALTVEQLKELDMVGVYQVDISKGAK